MEIKYPLWYGSQPYHGAIDNGVTRKPYEHITGETSVTHPATTITDNGFTALLDNGSTEEISWSQIDRILTYKVDNHVYDTIWLAFVKGGVLLQISEEGIGFVELMTAMNRAFPGIDQEWYVNVMLPTFEEKMTVLFERSDLHTS